MNDKIKEILDKLQKVANRETASRNALMEMKDKDYQLLLDYITNLQQEYERLKTEKEQLNSLVNSCQEEIRKLKAINDNNQLLDYKSRVEKAIEYINENKHLSMFADCREPEEDWNYDLECSANDLLNILQNGSDSQ